MSDLDFDDDKRFHGYPIRELNDIIYEERRIMLAEREVDDHFCLLSVFQRKGYDRGTKQWAARLMVEAEENNNEERGTRGLMMRTKKEA